MQPLQRKGRCLILGLAHMLVLVLGALLDPLPRPEAGAFAVGMFTLAASALVLAALLLTWKGAVNCITAVPLALLYVTALTAVLWCSNTGVWGFGVAGNIGTNFLVLVFFSSLPVDPYEAMSQEDIESFDPRLTT